jgi:hypothetical protein
MVSKLVDEIGQFHDQVSILKQLNWDTTKILQEIRNSGCLPQDSDSAYIIPDGDLDTLSRVCETLPTIVVIGQSLYAKVVVVNELLGEAVLPDGDGVVDSESWRTIRLKFGPRGVSLVLPDSYVLASTLSSFEREGQCVPRRDLELKDDDKLDPALTLSVAEVTLPHPLFKAGAQVICSSTGLDSTNEQLEQKVKAFCEGAVPVLIYAIEHEELSEQVKIIFNNHLIVVCSHAILQIKRQRYRRNVLNDIHCYIIATT